jgi:hypothetical protein
MTELAAAEQQTLPPSVLRALKKVQQKHVFTVDKYDE